MYCNMKRLLSKPMIPLNSGFCGNNKAILTASHSAKIIVHIHLEANLCVAVLKKLLIPVTSSISAIAKAPIPMPWYINKWLRLAPSFRMLFSTTTSLLPKTARALWSVFQELKKETKAIKSKPEKRIQKAPQTICCCLLNALMRNLDFLTICNIKNTIKKPDIAIGFCSRLEWFTYLLIQVRAS